MTYRPCRIPTLPWSWLFLSDSKIILTCKTVLCWFNYACTTLGLCQKRDFYFDNYSWSPKNRSICDQAGGANFPKPLTDINSSFLLHLSLLCCVTDRILSYPEVYQEQPSIWTLQKSYLPVLSFCPYILDNTSLHHQRRPQAS